MLEPEGKIHIPTMVTFRICVLVISALFGGTRVLAQRSVRTLLVISSIAQSFSFASVTGVA